MVDFENQRVIVTGAGCGIGFEICRQFALQGAEVGLNDIDKAKSVEAAERINCETGKDSVKPMSFDIADVSACKKAVSDFSADNGLDVFIANAGITVFSSFRETEEDDFDRLCQVNLKGTYFSVQAAAEEMISSGRKGSVVLMSSVTGIQAHRNLSAYGMTKAAVRMLTKSLSEELGDYGINVNAVGPGATLSERTVKDDPVYAEGWRKVTPNRMVGKPEDVAHTVLFLANRKSAHISGEIIMVDGGWTITSPLPEHLND